MNVLDIDGSVFKDACYDASQSLMRNARQQTDPSQMLCCAVAAQYVEGYAEQVSNMYRDKVLATFDRTLPRQDRAALSAIPKGGALPPETVSQLELFLEDTAYLHARKDVGSGTIDCNSPNFAAVAMSCALEVSGFDEYEVASYAAELRRNGDNRNDEGVSTLRGNEVAPDFASGYSLPDGWKWQCYDDEDAPDFTSGYPLPDGWKWQCYNDGSGGLVAPDGESFFSYDLFTGEMTDENGNFTHILGGEEIFRLLTDKILPDYNVRRELATQHPDWWVAFGSQGRQDVLVPETATRVLIAPGKSMDAATFSGLLDRAHQAEERNYSDATISAQDFAWRLSRVSPGSSLRYEGEAFDYDDIWGGGEPAGGTEDVTLDLGVPTVSFKSDITGEMYTLALYTDRYMMGNNLTLSSLDLSEPIVDDYVESWGTLSVNLPDVPNAADWCSREGNIVLDTNNCSRALVNALVSAGVIELTGESVRSGFCTYPLCTITSQAMDSLTDYEATVNRILAAAHKSELAPSHEGRDTAVSLMGEAQAMRDAADRFPSDGSPSMPEPEH